MFSIETYIHTDLWVSASINGGQEEKMNSCADYAEVIRIPLEFLMANIDILNLRLTMGGYLEPPSRFSPISSKQIDLSAPNFQYLLVHQFYISWLNKNFVPIIGRPEMTSEWRHVRSILMQINPRMTRPFLITRTTGGGVLRPPWRFETEGRRA